MIDIPISILIQVAKDIYVFLNKDNNPDGLSGDTLAFFQGFKKAYESKDLEEIGKLISTSYSGNFFYTSNREELLKTFDLIFKKVPDLCQLKLIIKRHLRKSPNALYRYFWNL
ncbi:hypothetical protein [Planktothrix pseudagardhii]|uniref:Uncharacterized protein n=1 Tax=Planktothrix pseudagardhii TaxID=132604 RepID=A0A9W4CI97_9CYAN|nr:hypothetical protein [Planktothrix pseudagardhii]CAD5913776.1 hypothetical protein NO713_00211 [Planktothrix pseudagardhii]